MLSTALLGGCAFTNDTRPTLLKVALASNENEENAKHRFESEKKISKDFLDQLETKQPGIRLHISIYPAKQIEQELEVQTNSGLGPDLIIANSNQTLNMLAAGLTEPIQITKEREQLIFRAALERVKTTSGSIAGQPVSQYVQLACFDKRKLDAAPTTLNELSIASSKSNVFGMVTDFEDLYWSLGSFGAGEALTTSLAGRKPSIAAHKRLTEWLQWLKASSYQQNIVFLQNQSELRSALINGEMSWISCWSSQLPQLREELKEHLGIAPLPSGSFGRATPITRLQVWALGKNSSKRQRKETLKLLKFIMQPWAQKTYSLNYKTNYPVNPAAAMIIRKQLPFKSADESEMKRVSQGDAIMATIHSKPSLDNDIQSTLRELIFDGLSPEQAATALEAQLKANR